MTPEEMQRTMEFIVGQQAKFAADIQKLFESDDRLRESQATLTAAVIRIAEIVEGLGESQKANEERFRQTDQRFRETDERLRHTDERLNVLINVIEAQAARRRNGKKRRK